MVCLNGTGELIIRNHKLGLVAKRKEGKLTYKRTEFLDEQNLVLLHQHVDTWNFIQNRYERIDVGFQINDLIVLP